MSTIQTIINAKDSMLESPLQQMLRGGVPAPVPIDEDILIAEKEKMSKLVENMDSSLKVVIMGEVKAGKSTLLNALAGSNVSPSDIAEATGTVIEIKYNPIPYGKILLNDRTVKDIPEKIFAELARNNNNQDFFKNCLGVEFGFPVSGLKEFTLVDTPGLETITDDNSNRTKEYIAKTDVVIWVFNGHHLGQADVEEALIEVNRLGKPIVAVINRIDEIDEDPEVLIEYLEEEMGLFVEEIIAISAAGANRAVQLKDKDLLGESGLSNLIGYLDQNIAGKSQEVKKGVLFNSAQALMNRDLLIHEEYLKTLGFIEEQIEQIQLKVNTYSGRIHDHILYEFERWYDTEFLKEEKENLKNKIRKSNIIQLKKGMQEVEQRISSIFSQQSFSKMINEKVTDLDNLYISEWKEAVEKVKSSVLFEINEYKNNAEKRLEMKLSNEVKLNEGESDLMTGASKGAWLGGATGAASAFYAAALGPAASTVTIGMAATAFLPPMLLIGATFGAVSSFLKFKSDKSLAEKNIDDIFKNVKEEQKKEIFKAINEKYSTQDEQIKENIQSVIVGSFANGIDSEGIASLKIKIDKYMYEIKKYIEDLRLVEV
ncbi:GTP-binding protein [Rossellomorea vietnamensis]|uniref:GTP-binding protein n=1 Tax=Rossellomorea vietnamensis TaxID=218284 RepID=A0A5D4K849_9BACI|nr:dynamin family protein [Rossellomorea vietnamensis]TYR73458.1 GTP-binding protein [Rossellomorea vietnamensis]